MRRPLLLATPLLALFAIASCTSGKTLLCQSDSDCASGQVCEIVSGLCKPAATTSKYQHGSTGSFDCPITDNTLKTPPAVTELGLATFFTFDLPPRTSCVPPKSTTPPGRPTCTQAQHTRPDTIDRGVQVGCEIVKETARTFASSNTHVYYVIYLRQADTTYSDPRAELTMVIRADDLKMGSLSINTVHTRFLDRCDNGSGPALHLRSVATCGTLDVVAFDQNHVQANFDFELLDLETFGQSLFGEACTLPRSCGDGCSTGELASSQCYSGECFPNRDEPASPIGVCSGECTTDQDCRSFEDPHNYCFYYPGEVVGTCIHLCSPAASNPGCPSSSSCRPGSDFADFIGQPGPPRCVDNCVRTASHPVPSAGCPSGTGDGGVSNPDARTLDALPMDAPAADAIAPDAAPADAALDGGVARG